MNSRSIPHDSSRQESGHGTTDHSIKLSAGFRAYEQAWQSVQQAEGTKDSEPQTELGSAMSAPITEMSAKGKSISAEASEALIQKPKPMHSDYTVKHRPQCEPSSGKRSWSTVVDVPDAKLAAGKASRSSFSVQSDDAIQNVALQFGYSEDYFRLMAHIFNCIFR
jgi:hypothetical protein